MSSTDLELKIHLALEVSAELQVSVPARFSYMSADPYAVHASFYLTPDRLVHWVFARDLLDQGMYEAAGIGDVRIAPIDGGLGFLFSIELESSHGYARLEGPVAPVKEWIATTYEAVPAGSETAPLDTNRFFEEHSGR
ncbi:SsgA family sporulation/cell division regulator [Streptomyces sp. NPDC101209]|uniref:SsgA family sporulation/cell division regulator n=1 Tax=Streptomyces sp. NPDC101209 TaxID=3366129 RepID=UPI00381CAF4F